MPPLGKGRELTPSGGVQVFQGLIHEWGKRGLWDEQQAESSNSSYVVGVPSVVVTVFQSIYIPTLTYNRELWAVTERIRSRIQLAEMSFLRWLVVRSSAIWEELGVELLLICIERSHLRWFGHLIRMPTDDLLHLRVLYLSPEGSRAKCSLSGCMGSCSIELAICVMA